MADKILGTYTVRKSGNANSVTLPLSSGLIAGDKVILKLKDNGDILISKQDRNFWETVPQLSEEEYNNEIKDLGYDPLNQTPVGKERIED